MELAPQSECSFCSCAGIVSLNSLANDGQLELGGHVLNGELAGDHESVEQLGFITGNQLLLVVEYQSFGALSALIQLPASIEAIEALAEVVVSAQSSFPLCVLAQSNLYANPLVVLTTITESRILEQIIAGNDVLVGVRLDLVRCQRTINDLMLEEVQTEVSAATDTVGCDLEVVLYLIDRLEPCQSANREDRYQAQSQSSDKYLFLCQFHLVFSFLNIFISNLCLPEFL